MNEDNEQIKKMEDHLNEKLKDINKSENLKIILTRKEREAIKMKIKTIKFENI